MHKMYENNYCKNLHIVLSILCVNVSLGVRNNRIHVTPISVNLALIFCFSSSVDSYHRYDVQHFVQGCL